MKIFQRAYDLFRNIKTPTWYKTLMAELQDIIIQILLQVGRDFIAGVEAQILEVSKLDMPNRKKFERVFNYIKVKAPTMKDSAINLLLEALFSRLKSNRVI